MNSPYLILVVLCGFLFTKTAGIYGDDIGELTRTMRAKVGDLTPNTITPYENAEELNIQACSFHNVLSNAFQSAKNLNKIKFFATSIENFPAGLFAGLDNLKELTFLATTINNLDTKAFTNLRSLENLTFHSSTFGDIKENMFEGCTNLNRLELTACGFSSIDLRAFNGLSNLRELHLQSDCIDGFSFQNLPSLPKLRMLNLGGDPLKNLDLTNLKKNCPSLETIQISADVSLSQNIVQQLGNLNIHLDRVDVTLSECIHMISVSPVSKFSITTNGSGILGIHGWVFMVICVLQVILNRN